MEFVGVSLSVGVCRVVFGLLCVLFFFFKQKTAYEVVMLLEFRRVLFRSHTIPMKSFHIFLSKGAVSSLVFSGASKC